MKTLFQASYRGMQCRAKCVARRCPIFARPERWAPRTGQTLLLSFIFFKSVSCEPPPMNILYYSTSWRTSCTSLRLLARASLCWHWWVSCVLLCSVLGSKPFFFFGVWAHTGVQKCLLRMWPRDAGKVGGEAFPSSVTDVFCTVALLCSRSPHLTQNVIIIIMP